MISIGELLLIVLIMVLVLPPQQCQQFLRFAGRQFARVDRLFKQYKTSWDKQWHD